MTRRTRYFIWKHAKIHRIHRYPLINIHPPHVTAVNHSGTMPEIYTKEFVCSKHTRCQCLLAVLLTAWEGKILGARFPACLRRPTPVQGFSPSSGSGHRHRPDPWGWIIRECSCDCRYPWYLSGRSHTFSWLYRYHDVNICILHDFRDSI